MRHRYKFCQSPVTASHKVQAVLNTSKKTRNCVQSMTELHGGTGILYIVLNELSTLYVVDSKRRGKRTP
jgi:hypothetical protein